MEDDPSLKRCVKILLVCILLIFGVVTAAFIFTDNTVNAAQTNSSIISGHFKPSVGKSGFAYKWHSMRWVNYCPGCKRHGTLMINPKGVPEREITCWKKIKGRKGCGADYCGVTGLDKAHKRRWRLTRAEGAKPLLVNVSKVMPSQKVTKTSYFYRKRLRFKVVRQYTRNAKLSAWKLSSRRTYYWSKRLRKWRRA
jgi:N-acetylmuramoyl-L-alanine amidase